MSQAAKQRRTIRPTGSVVRGHEWYTRLRVFLLLASFVALASVLVAWLVVRNLNLAKSEPPHTSVLDLPIEDKEFSADLKAEDLLTLADRQTQKVIEAFPKLSAAYNLKANRDYLLGDMDVAKQSWSQALTYDSRSSEALFGLALIAFEASEYERAIELCEQSVLLRTGNPRVPLLLAESYLQNGQADRATMVLSQHIATEPTSVQALELLGTTYLNARDFENAIAQFKRVLVYSPNSKDAYYGLAQAHTKLGKVQEAKEYMAKFDEMSRKSGDEHSKEAQRFRDRAYASHVAAQVYADSSLIHKQQGDYRQAADCLLRAQKLQPDVVTWLEELQRVYFLAQDHRSAADVGERLVVIDDKNVEHWLNLGQVYSDLGLADPALRAFQKAIELAPGDARCQKAQEVIRKMKVR